MTQRSKVQAYLAGVGALAAAQFIASYEARASEIFQCTIVQTMDMIGEPGGRGRSQFIEDMNTGDAGKSVVIVVSGTTLTYRELDETLSYDYEIVAHEGQTIVGLSKGPFPQSPYAWTIYLKTKDMAFAMSSLVNTRIGSVKLGSCN